MTSSISDRSTFLAIDVGNTSIHFALCLRGRFVKNFWVLTKDHASLAIPAIRKHISGHPDAVIASVVPSVGHFLMKNIRSKLGWPVDLIGKDLFVPIKNRYQHPKQVGVDRLLSALAAYHEYKRELIILDFGTAITFDVVSRKGEYLGGVIAPGIEISIDALSQRTALLPKIKLAHPRGPIGRNTVESIRIGCSVGIGGLCDRIVEQICVAGKLKPIVIATGGYAKFMSRYSQNIQHLDPMLVVKGIWLTHQANKLRLTNC